MHPYHHPLFCKFIVYFNENQDYFECHEVLEDYWKSIPGYTKEHPLTAFILLATGMYHWRRDNHNGAYRTMLKAERRMLDFTSHSELYIEEINFKLLLQDLQHALENVKSGLRFVPFKIDISSHTLKRLVENSPVQLELLPADSDAVIHKHMLRDRTDILAEREKKKGRPE